MADLRKRQRSRIAGVQLYREIIQSEVQGAFRITRLIPTTKVEASAKEVL